MEGRQKPEETILALKNIIDTLCIELRKDNTIQARRTQAKRQLRKMEEILVSDDSKAASPPVNLRRAKIHLDEFGMGTIEIDGIRLEGYTEGVGIHILAGHPSVVLLHIPLVALELDIAADVRTMIEELRPEGKGENCV